MGSAQPHGVWFGSTIKGSEPMSYRGRETGVTLSVFKISMVCAIYQRERPYSFLCIIQHTLQSLGTFTGFRTTGNNLANSRTLAGEITNKEVSQRFAPRFGVRVQF